MAARLPRSAVPISRLSSPSTSSQSRLRPFARSRCSQPSLFRRSDQTRALSVQAALQSQANPMPSFTYSAAASFSSKYNRFDPLKNVFHHDSESRTPPQKNRPKSQRHASGQDAFFITNVGSTGTLAFGVADGVGGWEDSGVDPADFSHSLCDYMAFHANDSGSGSNPLAAQAVMQRGYDETCNDRTIHAGGSTAIVGMAAKEGKVDVANLGDSGFVHLRLNAVHSYSDAQTHAFNTPYQLSIIPASMLARAAAFGGAQLCDYPKDADVSQHTVKHGDVLIFASDGVWDNLFNQDILRIASRLMTGSGAWRLTDGGTQVADDLTPFTQIPDASAAQKKMPMSLQSALALEITGRAKAASLNQRLDGPFAKEVQKYYPQENWHGGKVDDICVVAIVVSEEGRAETAVPKSKL